MVYLYGKFDQTIPSNSFIDQITDWSVCNLTMVLNTYSICACSSVLLDILFSINLLS